MLNINKKRVSKLVDSLSSISDIDGRYQEDVLELYPYFSEASLHAYRLKVEVEYLISLSDFKVIRKIKSNEKKLLQKIYKKFSIEDAKLIRKIERKGFEKIKATNHDVKAVEYFIRHKIKNRSLKDLEEFIHFGLTSEDVNNLSISLMVKDALNDSLIPSLKNLIKKLLKLTLENKKTVMPAKTHGQYAVPTTLGKEFAVYLHRLVKQLDKLNKIKLEGKLNGAVGNYNALNLAYPKVNWLKFSSHFISKFNLKPNLITTQIENQDSLIELFDIIKHINGIILDLNVDCWLYTMQGYFNQKKKSGEVGSSIMPQKVNPIDFENSEGNLAYANAILSVISERLVTSRMQRDLSNSTVLRKIGSAFAYSLIGVKKSLKGLNKIEPNKKLMLNKVKEHPEMISAGIQTYLRKEGYKNSYELLKELTRGKKVKEEDFHKLIKRLKIKDKSILNLKVENYLGIPENIINIAVKDAKRILKNGSKS